MSRTLVTKVNTEYYTSSLVSTDVDVDDDDDDDDHAINKITKTGTSA